MSCVVGRCRACVTAHAMDASTHHVVLAQYVWIATFMARSVTDTGWMHNVATCIHVEILSRKHIQEKWNGMPLMSDPMKMIPRVAADVAHRRCRLGPHFNC